MADNSLPGQQYGPQHPAMAKKTPQFRSRSYAAIWELASGMHQVGGLTDCELSDYAAACFVAPPPRLPSPTEEDQ